MRGILSAAQRQWLKGWEDRSKYASFMNKNYYSLRPKRLSQLTPKEIIGHVRKTTLSIMGRERDRDIAAYFKNKERFFLTSISSNSFLVLMNSSADCSSVVRRRSSLLEANESQSWEKFKRLALLCQYIWFLLDSWTHSSAPSDKSKWIL